MRKRGKAREEGSRNKDRSKRIKGTIRTKMTDLSRVVINSDAQLAGFGFVMFV